MEAQIIVQYKGGHKRVINVSPEFFETRIGKGFSQNQVKSGITKCPSTKAVDLANYLDPDPYTVELLKDGKTVIKHFYPANKPN